MYIGRKSFELAHELEGDVETDAEPLPQVPLDGAERSHVAVARLENAPASAPATTVMR
jgi:hypothetical protein